MPEVEAHGKGGAMSINKGKALGFVGDREPLTRIDLRKSASNKVEGGLFRRVPFRAEVPEQRAPSFLAPGTFRETVHFKRFPSESETWAKNLGETFERRPGASSAPRLRK